jgi:ABC-type lipoprotein export system ATPase subunit
VADELLTALEIVRKPVGAASEVLRFTYQFRAATFYELAGPDDGGKHLALQLLGLRLEPEEGEIRLEGQRVTGLESDIVSEIRNQKFGFLFAAPFLLPAFSVLENVAMPLFKIAQVDAREAKRITEEVLELVGIMSIVDVKPNQLSPLEQALAALARAVVHHPRLLVIEELGHNLDFASAGYLRRIVRRIPEHMGIAVIATAAPHPLEQVADVRLEFVGGRLKEVMEQSRDG